MKHFFLLSWVFFLSSFNIFAQIRQSDIPFGEIENLTILETKYGKDSEEYTSQLLAVSEICQDTAYSFYYPMLVERLGQNLSYIETHYGINSDELYRGFTSLACYLLYGLEVIEFKTLDYDTWLAKMKRVLDMGEDINVINEDDTSKEEKEIKEYTHKAFSSISSYDEKIFNDNPYYYEYTRYLSFIYLRTGSFDKAKTFVIKKLEVEEKNNWNNSIGFLESVSDLAEICSALEDKETIDLIIHYLKGAKIPNSSSKTLYYSIILNALPTDLQLSDIRVLLEDYADSQGDLSSLYRFYSHQAYGKRTDILNYIEKDLIPRLHKTSKDIHNFFYFTTLVTLCYRELADFTCDYIAKAIQYAIIQGERLWNYNCVGSPCSHIWMTAALCYEEDSPMYLFYLEKAMEETKIDFGIESEEYKYVIEKIRVAKSKKEK